LIDLLVRWFVAWIVSSLIIGWLAGCFFVTLIDSFGWLVIFSAVIICAFFLFQVYLTL
jgi:hypothetical protein